MGFGCEAASPKACSPLTIVFSIDSEELLRLSLQLADGLLLSFTPQSVLRIGFLFRSASQVSGLPSEVCYPFCCGLRWAMVLRVTPLQLTMIHTTSLHPTTLCQSSYLLSASSLSLFSFASCASIAAFACFLNSSADFSSFALLLLIIWLGVRLGVSEVTVVGLRRLELRLLWCPCVCGERKECLMRCANAGSD